MARPQRAAGGLALIERLRLLVVEDSEDDTDLMVGALRESVPEVEFERVETRGALEKALEAGGLDLVLTDHSMPHLRSLDVVRIVRERAGDLPVILISGKIGEEAAVAAMRAGANDYVSKDRLALLAPAADRAIASVEEKRRREQAEDEIERIFRLSHDMIAVASFEGELKVVNPAWERVLGYTSEELVGRPITRFLHPVDREAMKRALEGCRRGAPVADLENRARGKNGDHRWLLWHVVPDTRKGVLYAVARDLTERKSAEDALRDREETLLRVVETIPDGLVMLDTEGHITFVNTSAARMSGEPAGALIGRRLDDPAWEIHDASGVPIADAREGFLDVLASGKPRLGLEVSLKTASGETIHLRVNAVPLVGVDGAPTGVLVTLTDISARRADEQALRRWGLVFERAGWGIALADARSRRILVSNPAFAKMHGYDTREILSRDVSAIEVAGPAKTPGPYEAVHVRKDRSTFPALVDVAQVSENGGTRVDVLNVQDISERKRAEEALRDSEERWRSLVANAPAAIVTLSYDCRVEFANEAAPNPARTGASVCDWILPEERDRFRRIVRGVFETREAAEFEMKARGDDGEMRWYQMHASALMRGDEVTSLLLIATDTTERRLAEEQLRGYHDRLEAMVEDRTAALKAANKELESFSYAVSHDLRAPLRGIDVYAQTLDEDHGPQLSEDARELIARIRGEAHRLKDLIEALLDLSRIAGGDIHRERVDLCRMANEVVAALRAASAGRHIQFQTTGALEADCDPRLVRTMLENLIGNAWKYTSKREDAAIELGTRVVGNETCFYVRDNGAGFDASRAERLFAPFQRYHSAQDFAGTGVGLATVKRIVQRHGGRIWAESAIGRGASFFFTLGGHTPGEHAERPSGGA